MPLLELLTCWVRHRQLCQVSSAHWLFIQTSKSNLLKPKTCISNMISCGAIPIHFSVQEEGRERRTFPMPKGLSDARYGSPTWLTVFQSWGNTRYLQASIPTNITWKCLLGRSSWDFVAVSSNGFKAPWLHCDIHSHSASCPCLSQHSDTTQAHVLAYWLAVSAWELASSVSITTGQLLLPLPLALQCSNSRSQLKNLHENFSCL